MRDLVDDNDPASALEAQEEHDYAREQQQELATAMGRLLAWILEGNSYSSIGYRAMILAYQIRPELIGGKTLAEIGKPLGYGRSASHKLSKELEQVFSIRSINSKSDPARITYRKVWRAANLKRKY